MNGTLTLPDVFIYLAPISLLISLTGVIAALGLGVYVLRESSKPARLLGCVALSNALMMATIGNGSLGVFLEFSYLQWLVHVVVQDIVVAFNTYALFHFYQHFRNGG